MALVRVYCGLAAAEVASWLTAAVVDDAGRLLEVRDISDDPVGYAQLAALLAERSHGGAPVAVAADRGSHLVSQLLSAANRWLCVADDDVAVDDFAERFADDSSPEEMESPPAERRAVGLARALQAGAVSIGAHRANHDLDVLKPILAAHTAIIGGRHSAAVALREVLRELYPAALRAFPDPAEQIPLAVLDRLPEPGLLSNSSQSRNRDATIISEITGAESTDPSTVAAAVTALRVAVAEANPRRAAPNRQLAPVVAESVRQCVAAVRAYDRSAITLVGTLVDRLGATGTPTPVPRSAPPALAAVPDEGPASRVPAPRRRGAAAPQAPAAASSPVAPIAPVPLAPMPVAPMSVPPTPVAPMPVAPAASIGAVPQTPVAMPLAPMPAPLPLPPMPAAPVPPAAMPASAPPAAGRPYAVPGYPEPAPYGEPAYVDQAARHDAPAHEQQPARRSRYGELGNGYEPSYDAVPFQPPAYDPAAFHQPAEFDQPGGALPRRRGFTPPPEPETWREPSFAPAGPDYAAAPNPGPAPGVPAPGSRADWPLVPRGDDDLAVRQPAYERRAVAQDRPEADREAPTFGDTQDRVAPPWLADDMPTEPPVLRLVDSPDVGETPPTHDPLTDPLQLDSTGEMHFGPPQLRVVDSAGSRSAGRSRRNSQERIAPMNSAPATVEADGDLLIFSQARSAWFTHLDEDEPRDTEQLNWASVADEGWRAAEQAARPAVGAETMAGLPRRVPQANLVPGSAASQPRPLRIVRDAASIAEHTTGYFRGWRRGQEIGGFAVGQRDRGAWDFNREQRSREARDHADQRARRP